MMIITIKITVIHEFCTLYRRKKINQLQILVVPTFQMSYVLDQATKFVQYQFTSEVINLYHCNFRFKYIYIYMLLYISIYYIKLNAECQNGTWPFKLTHIKYSFSCTIRYLAENISPYIPFRWHRNSHFQSLTLTLK